VTEPGRDARGSLELKHVDGVQITIQSQTVATRPYARHRATAYLFNGSGSAAVLTLEFWSASGKQLATASWPSSQQNTWEEVNVTALSPADAALVSVSVTGLTYKPGATYVSQVALAAEAATRLWSGDKYLLFDDHYVASYKEMSLSVHPASKHGAPLLTADRPWETNNVFLSGQVLCDTEEQLFKMWYVTIDPAPSHQRLALYATSRDGLHWNKPNLGVYAYQGSTNNNIIGAWAGPLSVIKDLQDPNPAHRYKMMAWTAATNYQIYFSPDGMHWTASSTNPQLPIEDVAMMFFDTIQRQYVSLSKITDPHLGRTVTVATSDDLAGWTRQQVVMAADQFDAGAAGALGYPLVDIYGMPAMPYGGIYVGFPWVFYHRRPPGQPDTGLIDVQLAFSRDLLHWERIDRTPAITRGPAGSFDSGMIFTANQPIVVRDELWLYYGGFSGLHAAFSPGAIGLATWPLDRLASWNNGGFIEGSLTTVPIPISGRQLVVNAAVRGELQIELLGQDGRPLPGFERANSLPIAGDELEQVARWKTGADLTSLIGKTLQLRFYVRDGELYSFELR
jgi:hypothetical protein